MDEREGRFHRWAYVVSSGVFTALDTVPPVLGSQAVAALLTIGTKDVIGDASFAVRLIPSSPLLMIDQIDSRRNNWAVEENMKEVFGRLERCQGCKSCEMACAVRHSASKNSLRSHVREAEVGSPALCGDGGRFEGPIGLPTLRRCSLRSRMPHPSHVTRSHLGNCG